MRVQELLGQDVEFGAKELSTIESACGQFLKESAYLPLYKLFPRTYNDLHRVKVRQQKRNDNVTEAFNNAFGTQFSNIRQRAIFTSPIISEATQDHEPFYVFPINAYRFLYSKEVTNSGANYQQVIETLFQQFEDNNKTLEVVTDILKYTYVRENLAEGISADAEIIFYGIPYFYALRVSAVPPYGKLFNK